MSIARNIAMVWQQDRMTASLRQNLRQGLGFQRRLQPSVVEVDLRPTKTAAKASFALHIFL